MKYETNLMLTDSSYKVLMDICTIQEVNLMKLCVIFFKMTLNQDSSTPVPEGWCPADVRSKYQTPWNKYFTVFRNTCKLHTGVFNVSRN